MQLPAKTKEITIKNNTYTVSFPNNRGLLSIYARKAQLTKDRYDSLINSNEGNSLYMATMCDAIAFFSECMPAQFFKDLNVSNLADLDAISGAELTEAYTRQFVPWYDQWINAIAEVMNPKKEPIQDAE